MTNEGRDVYGHKISSLPESDEHTSQLARNHYFTGKLLVERDFTDEQRYMLAKHLRHNRSLHGFGCVSGLRVKQHPEPAYQDSAIIIEPGTALDCSGHEIVVRREESLNVKKILAETTDCLSEEDDKEHTLQIRLHYKEHYAEQVPAFFDDCGDGTTSQPNRIVESYDFSVLLDPIMKRNALDDITFSWCHTLNISNVSRILVDEDNRRLYVLTTEVQASTLYVYHMNTNSPSLLTSQKLHAEATDMALAWDGKSGLSRIYVAVKHQRSVLVLDTARLGTDLAIINRLPSASIPDEAVRLAVSPRDGYLYVLDVGRKVVTSWRTGINHPSDDVENFRHCSIHVGNEPHGIIASPDGKWVCIANRGDKTISVIDALQHDCKPIVLHVAPISPSSLAIAETADGLKLYVADHSNKTLTILDLEPHANPAYTQRIPSISLAPDAPIDIAAASGGRWVYVLVTDREGKGHIQAIDTYSIEQKQGNFLGERLPVGHAPHQQVLIQSHHHLYVASQGRSGEHDAGGISLLEIHERRCEDIITSTLDGLPACSDNYEGIVLATITGYKFGSNITDEWIDNLSERHILPSTDLLTDMIRCILANGGGKGKRGEQGPAGRAGAGIEAVQAIMVDCDSPGSATLDEIDEKRTLILEIPRGCDAPSPTSIEYTRVSGLNWEHKGNISREELEENGLLIAFNRKVRALDINRHSFQVFSSVTDGGFIIWHQLAPRVVKGVEYVRGVELEVEEGKNDTLIILGVGSTHGHFVNGAQFRFARLPSGPLTLRVVLQGDQIQDEAYLGVDANHLPPWLPQRPTGDGIEGGTFESWFTVEDLES